MAMLLRENHGRMYTDELAILVTRRKKHTGKDRGDCKSDRGQL